MLLRSIARRCYSTQNVRVRFAPSPTGQLHIGGFRTALYNYLFAKKCGGQFILRLEDTDQARIVPGAADQMEQVLTWAGVVPDESPQKGGPHGPYVQSKRLDIYKKAVDTLIDTGNAYCCFCSERRLELLRREAARNRTGNKYDGRCRHLSKQEVADKIGQGLSHTVRFVMSPHNEIVQDLVFGEVKHSSFENEGDPVIVKSDGFPTYHLANVVDDHYMQVSHVFRGVEWQVSTPKHLLMYEAFGWQPPTFAHLPLIMNPDGTKLSKRQGDVHLEHYRDLGYYPEALVNFITLTGGGFTADRDTSGNTMYSMAELVERFDPTLLRTNSCQIDFDRLNQANNNVIRANLLEHDARKRLVGEARQILLGHVSNTKSCELVETSDEKLLKDLQWASDRMSVLSDITKPELSFIWVSPTHVAYDGPVTSDMISACVELLQSFSNETFTAKAISKVLRAFAKEQKVKFPDLMKCLRLLLSGLNEGPPVGEALERLGPKESLKRLQKVMCSNNNNNEIHDCRSG